jgi:hypothetical protein
VHKFLKEHEKEKELKRRRPACESLKTKYACMLILSRYRVTTEDVKCLIS